MRVCCSSLGWLHPCHVAKHASGKLDSAHERRVRATGIGGRWGELASFARLRSCGSGSATASQLRSVSCLTNAFWSTLGLGDRGRGQMRVRKLGFVLALCLSLPGTALAALPKTPTEGSYKVRPHIIGWTGDGTGYLGGFSGHSSLRRPFPLSDFGRLRWTTYSATQGYAWGADWLNNGIPDDASGTFTPTKVNVHVYRPRNGIFTRLAFNLGGKVAVLKWDSGIQEW